MEVIIGMLLSPEARKEILEITELSALSEVDKFLYKNVFEPAGDDELTYSPILAIIDTCKDEEVATLAERQIANAFRQISIRERQGEPKCFPDLSVNLAKQAIRNAKIQSLLVSAAANVNAGMDPVELYGKLSEEISNVGEHFSDRKEYELYVVDNEIKQRAEMRKEEQFTGKIFEFTEPVMKALFPYGVRQKQMFGVVADTGTGKSLTVDNWSIEAWKQGLNVLMIKTENEESVTTSRLDSIFSGQNYGKIFKGELSEQEIGDIDLEYRSLASSVDAHLFLAQVDLETFTVNTIRRIIDKIKADYDYQIDVLIIDSPEHQSPLVKRKDMFQEDAQVYRELFRLVKERELIFFSTLQRKVNHNGMFRKGKKGEVEDEIVVPEAEEAAGSAVIPRLFDYMITLMKPTQRDVAMGGVKMAPTKARNSHLAKSIMFINRDSSNLRQVVSEYDSIRGAAPPSVDGEVVLTAAEIRAMGASMSPTDQVDSYGALSSDFIDDFSDLE